MGHDFLLALPVMDHYTYREKHHAFSKAAGAAEDVMARGSLNLCANSRPASDKQSR